jgi:uncharacterized protein (DUF1501 family)
VNTELTLHTRREFLRRAVLGGALSWTVPSFLANTFAALQAEAADKSTQTATGKDASILVVLQMAGGNDGLNTVVPYVDDYYRRARPRLSLPDNKVVRVNDELALHSSLTGFKELYDQGHLAIIQGVGYPNPNRSHFRSTEIWQTATDANRFARDGWIGRFFDNACSGSDPAVGICMGRQQPQAFWGHDGKGIVLENPRNYRFLAGHGEHSGEMSDTEGFFRKMNEPESESPFAGASISSLHGSLRYTGSPLDFLERTALEAQVSSDEIRAVVARAQTRVTYPASQLGNSLRLVAQLIAGGLPTRIYYVSQGGYDTHTNQLAAQERLLKDLAGSIDSFVEDLKQQGNFSRVLLMTFSEFGRRVAENASGGTDHGAAAPIFVIGGKVKPGLVGSYPSLAPDDLFQGDLKFNLDFRSVYAAVLEQWLKTPGQPILGRNFAQIPLV